MATAINPFRKLQVGRETTKGTLVAATRQLVGDWSYEETSERYRSAFPRGINANTGGAGVDLIKAARVSVDTELTFEEILWPLLLGVRGAVTPGGAGDAKTWVFDPQLTVEPTLDTATVEVVEGDGTTNHIAREFGYAFLDEFEVEWATNEVAKLKYSLVGRASQPSTPTGALAPYANREEAKSALTSVYLDAAGADLGDTQLTGVIRQAAFKYTSPFTPKYTLDGRADLDHTGHHFARGFKATLSLTMELDATGAARVAAWRANDVVFIRVATTGSEIETGPSVYKSVIIDGAYRFTGAPAFSGDGDNRLVAFDLESVYDPTWAKSLLFTVINREAAI
jgi:hypothetical protein